MRPHHLQGALACAIVGATSFWASAEVPKFRAEEIDKSLRVGYAVLLEDINADGKKDILVCDSERIIWFENGNWKLHTILQGQTRPDNVTFAAHDINGDGKLDLALGAGWQRNPPGSLQWLEQGANVDEPWKLHPMFDEPVVHRIKWGDLTGDGKPELIVTPLHNAGSTARGNWSEKGVRFYYMEIPKNPASDTWQPRMIDDQSLHALHNFHAVNVDDDKDADILTASYEGVVWWERSADGKWTRTRIGEGNQASDNPNKSLGSSEIKLGRLKGGRPFIATVEPWHGFEIVVYAPKGDGKDALGQMWERKVIDKELKWGHAVQVADLDGDGGEELIIGVRDAFNDQLKSGIRVYDPADGKWERHIIDPGGVAVEDAVIGDLNSDGKAEIVAVGRATRNVKIYWNEGK